MGHSIIILGFVIFITILSGCNTLNTPTSLLINYPDSVVTTTSTTTTTLPVVYSLCKQNDGTYIEIIGDCPE